ncbi:MAG TPA: serine hydrolase domain-containing protein [Rhizomicrobium sp.]|jgi:CubicO group peptidase (beta-lactamase class C family)|nr:serine hydrolase domain-containing protein [Rhizomicrobium sp.]
MTDVHGTVAKGYEKVREGFIEGQKDDSGGAQLCVYRGGEKVVDLWGGRDTVNDRPYTDETITVCFSVSKGATATMAHMLAERGQLDFAAPVARYWPEFAQNGKAHITVADAMAHRAGLNSFDPDIDLSIADMGDWTRCTGALAAMAPLWEPKSAMSYHALTFGFLIGEVIRRITGKTPGTFFAEAITGPLGLDLWIGLPAREEHRVAPHFSEHAGLTVEQITALLSALGIDTASRMARATIKGAVDIGSGMAFINSREGHAAQIPAGNMIGNAASLAKMYAATIGTVDGVRLLKPETVQHAMELQTAGLLAPGDFAKMPAPSPHVYGLGYQLTRMAAPMLGEGSFGHDGAGGRIGFAHPGSGTAVGYVCNNMLWDGMTGPDARWVPWTKALMEIVGV